MRNPYVTGAFVVGSQHYGREELIETLLAGAGRAYWITSGRRSGCTSLLRQLELVAGARGRFIPLYVDLQGATSALVLGRYLSSAVQDRAAFFRSLGLSPALLGEEDPLTLLTHLRRLALGRGVELLLLCDEADALVDMARTESEFMQRLHRELTLSSGLSTVVVSTRRAYRLYDACASWPGPSFLNGFDMTYTLGSLSAAAAKALITQSQAARGQRVKAPAAVVNAIRDATNRHPFLLQSLCAAVYEETGSLRMPEPDDLQASPAMTAMFEYDWAQMSGRERRVLLAATAAGNATARELHKAVNGAGELGPALASLQAQGFLRRTGQTYSVSNPFLAGWLRCEGSRLAVAPAAETSEAALRAILNRRTDGEVVALAEQLNARRGRLVELEAMRAEHFLRTSPQVLAEIAQLENEIGALRSLVVRRAAA